MTRSQSFTGLDIDDLFMSQQEIAHHLQISRQAVSKTEQRALIKFKERFKLLYPEIYAEIKKEFECGTIGYEYHGLQSM